jgi:hypothetical protein
MNEPTPTTAPLPATAPEDSKILANAQQRLMERRASEAPVSVRPVKDDLEAAIERVNRLPALHSKPIASVAGSAVEQLRTAAGIPPRHAYEIPDGDNPWNEARAAIVKRLGNGFLTAVTGIQGTGKTQLGSAVIYAATAKHLTCKYAVAMDFFIALKGAFNDGARQSEAQVIAAFVKPKLLVLDEMDERSESAWENRLLFHMINQRYNNLVDTLLISRKPETEFLQSLGTSLTSRIQETGGSLVCEWPSYREAGV